MSDRITNHIKQLITDLICGPADIYYDGSGVYVKGVFVPTENPRYYFAQALSFFEEDIRMYGRGYQSYFAENTVCDFRKIKFGYNCLIGGSGFGYEYFEGIPFRIPHLGNVIIHDGVEIHNSVCIDRAVIGSTVIGENCKIDNLVHIAHGVKIGKNCLIVAGTVIGGSCEIGENCFIGINASIKNKVKIGSNVTIGMGAVVTKDVPDGAVIVGNPGKQLEKLWPIPELKTNLNK